MSENIINCPNCGGVIHDCICDYCGTVLQASLQSMSGRKCLMISLDDNDQVMLYGLNTTRIEENVSDMSYYADNTVYHTFTDPEYNITASLQDSQSMSHILREFVKVANTRLKDF